jgi:hypothetical protein
MSIERSPKSRADGVRTTFNWNLNQEADDMLYEHFKERKSTSESAQLISAATGYKITHMAIIGRRKRRGLILTPEQSAMQQLHQHTLRRVSENIAKAKVKRIRIKKRYEVKDRVVINNTKPAWQPKPRETAPIEPLYPRVAPHVLPELGQCKYIYGDGNDAYICQGARVQGEPYCQEHMISCHQGVAA